MKKYYYSDNVFTIEGAISVESNADYTAPWRIDFERRKLFPFLDAFGQGDACPGVRIAFTTDSSEIGIEIYETYKGDDGIHDHMMLDLVSDGELAQTILPDKGKGLYRFDKLAGGTKDIEIWLDPKFPVKFTSICVDTGAHISKTASSKKRLVCYGSSITHSVRAQSPYYTWPGIAAKKKNMHLTNLGFGGNCILDPVMGHVMKDIGADIFCLELGANSYRGDLTVRSFVPCAIGLVETIRQKHKHTPIIILSPIYFYPGETERGGCGMNMQEIREKLKDMTETLREYGDENIYYANGLDVFGPDGLKYMLDKIHPNGEGQFVLADNFVENVIDKIDF